MRHYMLAAFDLGMTDGDYIFYVVDQLVNEQAVLYGNKAWLGNDGRNEDAKKALGAVLYVSTVLIDIFSCS